MVKIETPFLWFGQTLNGSPKPWRFFRIDGLLVNAYEILRNKAVDIRVREGGIHLYLKFDRPIMMDSGGFLFMNKRVLDVTPEMVLRLYEDCKPDFGVVLDHPLSPNLPNYINRWRRLKTLENTKQMLHLKQSSNPELIPVIHGYSLKSINWYLKNLRRIGDFSIYGIGSLVPSVFSSKGAGGIYNIIRIVSFIRKVLPDRMIHVFGIGSTLTMPLMFYAGADSVDSSSWRSKAAFGAIQLPGIGDRYITPRKRHKPYPQLRGEESRLLDECKCPACRESGFEGLRKSFTMRALHNAWVYQKEIEKTRKLVKDGEYEDYVKEVTRGTKFSSLVAMVDKIRGHTFGEV
jgi:tRNA-guanine family transglycosylase